jgi:hypothetical protein
MQAKNKNDSHIFAMGLFLLGAIGLSSILVLDKLYWQRGFLAEGWPDFSPSYLIRSVIIFISMVAIFCSFTGSKKPHFTLAENKGFSLEKLSIFTTLSISLSILGLFIFKPKVFNDLSLEDSPIEWLSALLLFGSCMMVAIFFLKSRKTLKISKFSQFSLMILCFLFFLMAMEEISWFQRVLEIETPETFNNNFQGEMNLHNFATNHVENMYYFGAFLFLVVLPFIRFLFPNLFNNNYLKLFVARPFIAVVGAFACAYNFDMWDIFLTQVAFWGSVVILFLFALFSNSRKERNIILVTLFVVATTQLLFLTNGANFARLWEITEYKELLIPMAFYIYSLDMFSYLKKEHLPMESEQTPVLAQ